MFRTITLAGFFAGFFSPFSSAGPPGSDGSPDRISGSAMSTVPTLATPMRSMTLHVFSFEIGAHSSMRTISPTWNSLAAS